MRRLAILLMALFVFSLAGSAAFAEERVHEEAKVKLWIPDNWKAEDGDDMLVITDPKEECMMMFMMLDVGSLEKAVDQLAEELSKVVKDLEAEGEAEETKVNGLDVVQLSAKGTVEGKAVDLGIMVILTPTGKAMLVFGMAETAKFQKHSKTIAKVMKSIKKS